MLWLIFVTECLFIMLTAIIQWFLQNRVTVTQCVRFNAILINSTLTNVFFSITARPKIFRLSVSVVPPRKFHAIKLERRADAIVLFG